MGKPNHPFKDGARFRHDACLDMDLEILSIRYAGPDYVVANVIYLNRNWENGEFVIDKENNVRLLKEHWPRWNRIK